MEATAILTVLTVTNVGSVITAGVSLLVMWKSGFFEEEKKDQLVTSEDAKPEMVKKIPDYEAYDNDELEENTKPISDNSVRVQKKVFDYYEENYGRKESEEAYYYSK